ncbi:hypothetical protein H0H92_009747 [Tricholoma furcatifolium]|nr:hypothetical protein H0H92_009747 [Tricholoma furcatifolium]
MLKNLFSAPFQRIRQRNRRRLASKHNELRYNMPISPQERIPPELLAEIFTYAFDSPRGLQFPVRVSQIPWVVGLVCTRWREISRAEPRLWSKVYISVGDRLEQENAISFLQSMPPVGALSMILYWNSVCVDRDLSPLIALYFTRSTELRLFITGHVLDQIATFESSTFEKIVDLEVSVTFGDEPKDSNKLQRMDIFGHMKHLRRLAFRSYWDAIGGEIARNPFIPYNELTHLDLLGVEFKDARELVSLLRLCLSVTSLHCPWLNPTVVLLPVIEEELLPCLTSVFIGQLIVWGLLIPWRRLITLSLFTLSRITTDELLDILEMTPCLADLTIYAQIDQENYAHHRFVSLANLYSIQSDSGSVSLLGSFVAPNIRELHLRRATGKPQSREEISTTVLNFMRQGCRLEALTVDMELNDDNIVGPPVVLTDLQTLYISSRDKWVLMNVTAPRLYDFSIRLAPLCYADRRRKVERADPDQVLNFLKRASQLGFAIIRFKRNSGYSISTDIRLQSGTSLVIQEHDRWVIRHLRDNYLAMDTRLPEEELYNFIARSGCTPQFLGLYVDP